jgi:hypothetical protein
MPYCYYTCNLIPLDLVTRAGYTPRWLGRHLRDPASPARRDALSVHPMTCPYVTKLVAAAEVVLNGRDGDDHTHDPSETDCLVVPGGCDAARRMGDLLAAMYPDRVYMLHVPRSSATDVAAQVATGLRHLEGWLRGRLVGATRPGGAEPAPGTVATAAASTAAAEPPAVEYGRPPRPGGVFVVSGPLSDDSLLDLIDRLGSHVSGLESCTSPDRWRPLAPGALGPSADYGALAAHILSVGMCPRRSTQDRRAYLEHRLDEAQPSSIIYARQSFCDPGAYDALLMAQLAQQRGLPFLEIEVDFPFDANGPLRVRVEAFLEAQLMDEDLLGAPDADDLFEEV